MSATALADEQRLANYQAGAALLERWIGDQLRYGFAALESDARARLEAFAALLTDAQLPGPAEALRSFASRVGVDADWAADLLRELGYWHLLARLVQQPARLAPYQLDGVLLALGLRVRRAALTEEPPTHVQTWTCVGVTHSERAGVFARHTYWLGERRGLWAEQHEYNYGSPPAPSQTVVGDAGAFGMYVYPGGLPGRVALPDKRRLARAEVAPPAFATLAEQRATNHRLLADQPWRRAGYFAVEGVEVRLTGDAVLLTDAAGEAVELPADRDATSSWQLLAVAGAAPAHVYGTLLRGRLRVLAVWQAGRLTAID